MAAVVITENFLLLLCDAQEAAREWTCDYRGKNGGGRDRL